ncbi:hypothetical protein SDC9_188906 [bioreactor metagenome]|uniref:Uncharacterized protein n=1 Tax=bioreactor metagenome TaxID=1076179 RepID=A0A645HQM6_9ZZZZ
MNRKEVINQLKELIEDRKSFMVGDYDEVYDKDVQALECAIEELEESTCQRCKENKFDKQIANTRLCNSCFKTITNVKF